MRKNGTNSSLKTSTLLKLGIDRVQHLSNDENQGLSTMRIKFFAALMSFIFLSGCGGGSGSTNDFASNSSTQATTKTPTTITNTPPLVNAGANFSAEVGIEITLGGSASDPDGDTLTTTWSFTSVPTDSIASLTDPGQLTATFTPDLIGTYNLELKVSDGEHQASDNITITVKPGNIAPVARIVSSQVIAPGSVVQADGTGSTDGNNDTLSYQWSFVSRPTGSSAVFSNANIAKPSFNADLTGTYVIQLIVNDGALSSNPVSATIIASSFSVTVSWAANNDNPAGYVIYTGPTIDTANIPLKILVRNATDWDPLNPSAILAGDAIIAALPNSSQACFVVRAYNGVGLSAPSDATCLQIIP